MIRSTLLLLTSSIIIFNTSCKKKEDVPKNETPSWVNYEGYGNLSFEANGINYAYYEEGEVYPDFFEGDDGRMVKITTKDYQRAMAMEITIYKDISSKHEYKTSDFNNYVGGLESAMKKHNIAIVYSYPFGLGIPATRPLVVTEGKCYIVENSDTQISGYFIGTTDPRGEIFTINNGYFKLKKDHPSWK